MKDYINIFSSKYSLPNSYYFIYGKESFSELIVDIQGTFKIQLDFENINNQYISFYPIARVTYLNEVYLKAPYFSNEPFFIKKINFLIKMHTLLNSIHRTFNLFSFRKDIYSIKY